MNRYPPQIVSRLACPQCSRKIIQVENERWICENCHLTFSPTSGGALDLRLKNNKVTSLNLPIYSETIPEDQVCIEKEHFNPQPEVDYSSIPAPRHVSPQTLSWFPKAKSADAMVIDIGCCDAVHRSICEHAGFIYAGIDILAEEAPILGDAHAVPFLDATFDFAISFCVFESIRNPFIAITEALRVLKPGGLFIGSVAFLEPYHDNSYFHFTHYGIYNVLDFAGFKDIKIFYGQNWTGLDAISQMGLFPRAPRSLSKAAIFPVKILSRLYWKAAAMIKSSRVLSHQFIKNAGAFDFIALKPG